MAQREIHVTLEEFREEWRVKVRELAVLLHQTIRGAPVQGRVASAVRDLAARLGGTLLFQPSVAAQLMALDLETGAEGEADQSLWDRAAASMALEEGQAATLAPLHPWWRGVSAAMQQERRALAERALAAPHDIELQEAVVAGLDRVQGSWLVMATAAQMVILSSVLR
ncbi:MAG: hypothetical protein J3K34DRAFT_448767, partial [Monoraphidium minutum]